MTSNKCRQMQKEKSHPKLFSCGIRLPEEDELGGLNSPIPSAKLSSSSHPDSSTAVPSSSPTSPGSSASNILKPPKKRYIVNGEFKCHSPLSTTTVIPHNNQTHSACSALLQLAEICANTGEEKSSAVLKKGNHVDEKAAILNGPSTSQYNYTPSSSSPPQSSVHHCVQEPQVSSVQSDFHKLEGASAPLFGKASVIQRSSGPSSVGQQDEPLNLCKEREKTFRASNQKLIDHFVDKFLCDGNPPQQGASFKPFSDLLSAVKLNQNHHQVVETRPGCFEFSLSAAIESVVDQVYNKDLHKTKKIDALKQDTAIYRKDGLRQNISCDTVSGNLETCSKESVFDDSKAEQIPVKSCETLSIPTENQNICSSSELEEQPSCSAGMGREESSTEVVDLKGEEVESKCRLISPPKKSRVWCNIFMNEHQSNESKSEALDSRQSVMVMEATSPARRKSQRTCKGRRYQALITEGLLQSTKERKVPTVKKHALCERPSKSKSPTPGDSALKVAKKKRKMSVEFADRAMETEGSDLEKCAFELDDKWSSTLPERLKADIKESQHCDSSHVPQDPLQKSSSCDRVIKTADSFS